MKQRYPEPVEVIRKKQYNLEECYLDNAGTTVPSNALINAISKELQRLWANPHSKSFSSIQTEQMVESTRFDILRGFFNCHDLSRFQVVFTSNATGAVKTVVQDGFLWYKNCGFNYLYDIDSHTSLIGARQLSKRFAVVSDFAQIESQLTSMGHSRPILVSWSAQSNFNGVRKDSGEILHRIAQFKKKNPQYKIYSLIDAASLCTTNPLDLSSFTEYPDFVVCSFYKVFGLPDLGALVCLRASAQEVFANKRYFGGGTVDVVSPGLDFHSKSRNLSTRLEDGTLPIHSILMLKCALETHKQIYGGFSNICGHVTELCSAFVSNLLALKHKSTGTPMVKIWSPEAAAYGNKNKQGPIIALSLVSSDGKLIGYEEFEKYVSANNISIRTGTLCNIGGFFKYTQQTDEDTLVENFLAHGHVCGDSQDLINGKITGVIRVSLGAMSTEKDCEYFCQNVQSFFKDTLITRADTKSSDVLKIRLKSIYIYPIKSCHFYKIPSAGYCEFDKSGLKWDRFFFLIDLDSKRSLQSKYHPKMVNIRPKIDSGYMTIDYDGKTLRIPLDSEELWAKHQYESLGDYCYLTEAKIVAFFSKIVGVSCTLACKNVSMQNESPFLLISDASIKEVAQVTGSDAESIFRANFVVEGNFNAYDEDNWASISDSSGKVVLENYSKCKRCHMITVNQETGKRDVSVFVELTKKRKKNGKIYFGQHMRISPNSRAFSGRLKCGDTFYVQRTSGMN